MDLIKGNLLFFLTVCAAGMFIVGWAKLDEGAFRRTFIYSRKASRKYEYSLLAKMLLLYTIGVLGAYHIIGYFFKSTNYNLWQVTFVVSLLMCIYFIVSNKVTISTVPWVSIVMLVIIMIAPAVSIFAALSWGVSLDNYCHWYTLGLVLLDLLFAKQAAVYWKKGDMQ